MTTSLLSVEFLLLSFLSVFLISVLSGSVRQAVFLAVNFIFVWQVLGFEGTLSTVLFCVLGYALINAHIQWPSIKSRSGSVGSATSQGSTYAEFLRWEPPCDAPR